MKKTKAWLIPILATAMMIFLVIGQTACPAAGSQKSAFEKGFAASIRVASYGNSAAESVLKAYNDHLISLAAKDAIFVKLKVVAKGGRVFHDTLAGMVERYPTGEVPAGEGKNLVLIFANQIEGPLLDILTQIGLLPPGARTLVDLAIAGLKLAVSTIRGSLTAFGMYVPLDLRGNAYATA